MSFIKKILYCFKAYIDHKLHLPRCTSNHPFCSLWSDSNSQCFHLLIWYSLWCKTRAHHQWCILRSLGVLGLRNIRHPRSGDPTEVDQASACALAAHPQIGSLYPETSRSFLCHLHADRDGSPPLFTYDAECTAVVCRLIILGLGSTLYSNQKSSHLSKR